MTRSTYTPELINGFLARVADFPLTELWLMDIDPERLNVVGGFAQRMVQAKGAPFTVHLTTDQREAVTSRVRLLGEVFDEVEERDARGREAMEAHRQALGAELAGLDRGKSALGAYGDPDAAQDDGPKFQDRKG